jgi:hypothetical protein
MAINDADLAGYATEDGYLALSYNNIYNYSEVASGTFLLQSLVIQLDAPYGLPCDAVVGDSLPSTAPDLSEFEDKGLRLDMHLVGDFEPHGGDVSIRADITDMWVIPEPAIFSLLALGSLLLRRQT